MKACHPWRYTTYLEIHRGWKAGDTPALEIHGVCEDRAGQDAVTTQAAGAVPAVMIRTVAAPWVGTDGAAVLLPGSSG